MVNTNKIGHGFTFMHNMPFNYLKTSKAAEHRRLKVFHHQGTKCCNPDCDKIGVKIMVGKDHGGGVHIDVYTEDNKLMTIDHIVPKSKGGEDDLTNLQPLCQKCNENKGSKMPNEDNLYSRSNQSWNTLADPNSKRSKEKLNRKKRSGLHGITMANDSKLILLLGQIMHKQIVYKATLKEVLRRNLIDRYDTAAIESCYDLNDQKQMKKLTESIVIDIDNMN